MDRVTMPDERALTARNCMPTATVWHLRARWMHCRPTHAINLLVVIGLIFSLDIRPSQSQSSNNEVIDGLDQLFGPIFHESEQARDAIEKVDIASEEEQKIGDNQLQTFLGLLAERNIRVTRRGRDAKYVSSLVQRIRPSMEHANRYPMIRVYIANTNDTDARAFPGGSIVVMTGLIELAESEATLVGILGHELSHIDHGHQLRMARAQTLAETQWDFADAAPEEMKQRIMMMANNFALPFRPEDEAIADLDGVTWAFELGYEPLEFARLFERYGMKYKREEAKNRNVPSFLLTHPSYANRLASIRKRATELKANSPEANLYIGRTNLKHRVKRQTDEHAK